MEDAFVTRPQSHRICLRRTAGFQKFDEHMAKEMTASALSTMRSRWFLHRRKTHSICRVVCGTIMFQWMVTHVLRRRAVTDASRMDVPIPQIIEEMSIFSTSSSWSARLGVYRRTDRRCASAWNFERNSRAGEMDERVQQRTVALSWMGLSHRSWRKVSRLSKCPPRAHL